MAIMTITIPDAKVQDVLDAIAGIYPIPTIPLTGLPQYTKAQWGREWLKRLIRRTVAKYKTDQAKIAVTVPEDPNIVDVT